MWSLQQSQIHTSLYILVHPNCPSLNLRYLTQLFTQSSYNGSSELGLLVCCSRLGINQLVSCLPKSEAFRWVWLSAFPRIGVRDIGFLGMERDPFDPLQCRSEAACSP